MDAEFNLGNAIEKDAIAYFNFMAALEALNETEL